MQRPRLRSYSHGGSHSGVADRTTSVLSVVRILIVSAVVGAALSTVVPASAMAASTGAGEIIDLNAKSCLDVQNGSTANGAVVQQWGCWNGPGQHDGATYLMKTLAVPGRATPAGAPIVTRLYYYQFGDDFPERPLVINGSPYPPYWTIQYRNSPQQ
jgi:hypothetical protein